MDRFVQAFDVFNAPMTFGMTVLTILAYMLCRELVGKPLAHWLIGKRMQANQRVVTVPIGILKELNSIGAALATGYPYGVFRLGDKIGDVTITSQEDAWGYMMTEKQLFDLQVALRDMRPFLFGGE